MGLDSVDLLMKIEDRFKISIPDAEAEQIYTVQDFYDVVERHVKERPEQSFAIRYEINQIIADHAGVDLSEVEPHKTSPTT